MSKFVQFSPRQKLVLTWWTEGSPYKDYTGIIADGSIRSGKSTAMSLSFVLWAMAGFNSRNFGICGKTIGSLRRNVIIDLKRVLENHGYLVVDKRTESLLIITKGEHTNWFYLFAGNDERSQDLIQGVTLAGVLFDEVALMPESFVNQATGRCSVEGSKLWFNCNPAGSRVHWFKVNWINQYIAKKLLYLHFTMEDNLSLSDEVRARYASMYAGVFYRRYIEGRWVAAEGVIYDMWSLTENVYEDAEMPYKATAEGRRYIAIDYGTANPMVFLDALYDGKNFWIRDEYYYDSQHNPLQVQKTDSEYGDDFEEFVNHSHDLTVIIDPSAVSFKMELRNRGYHIRDADNDVLDGIRITASLIQQRRLRVSKDRCKNLQREIESYVWDEKALQYGDERPVKQNDHAMDAMRYLCKTVINRRRLAI